MKSREGASTGSYIYSKSHTNLVVVWFVGEELRTHVVGCPYQCGGHVTGRLQYSTNKDTKISSVGLSHNVIGRLQHSTDKDTKILSISLSHTSP